MERETVKYSHFLVLGLKISRLKDVKIPYGVLEFPNIFSVTDDIIYSLVLAKEGKPPYGEFSDGMILVSSNHALSISEGMHYAHAVRIAPPVLYHRTAAIIDQISILPMSHDVYTCLTKPLTIKEIQKNCKNEIQELYMDPVLFSQTYGSCTLQSPRLLKLMMVFLKLYAQNPDFQKASDYLFKSMEDLEFDIKDWSENNFGNNLDSFLPISDSESSLTNAFKAIEAIVGEPSKNRTEDKIKKRLILWGNDPSEKVGFTHKESIVDKILKCHTLRDRIAAHGIGKYKRNLRLSEILDAQSLARHLLLTKVDKIRKP
jgi:hypothetical protein